MPDNEEGGRAHIHVEAVELNGYPIFERNRLSIELAIVVTVRDVSPLGFENSRQIYEHLQDFCELLKHFPIVDVIL